jgi:tetratricopeptide (TPR) repeat protein
MRKQTDIVFLLCDEIEQFLTKVKKVMPERIFANYMVQILMGKAVSYGIIGKQHDSIATYKRILSDYLSKDAEENVIRVHFNIASMYNDVGEQAKAKHHVAIVQKQWQQQEHDSTYLHYSIPILLGSIANQEGEYKRAIEHFQEAHDHITNENITDHHMLAELYREWTRAYKDAMMPEQALSTLEQYHTLITAMHKQDISSQIAAVQRKHEIAMVQLQNDYLEAETHRLQQEQKEQFRELKKFGEFSLLLHEGHRELLTEFEAMIRTYQKAEPLEQHFETMHTHLTTLQNNTINHSDTEFSVKMPTEFLASLKGAATTPLTDLEQKVASLIRSGFSTKQMPHFLHRSTGYLLQVRQSLKRKLPIPQKHNLKSFLMQL